MNPRACLCQRLRRLLPLLLTAALGACATPPNPDYQEAGAMLAVGRYEDALSLLEQRSSTAPRNLELRAFYLGQRETIIGTLLEQADFARASGLIDEAELSFRRVLKIDARNGRAMAGLRNIDSERRHLAQVAIAERALRRGDTESARTIVRQVLAENPAQRDARSLGRRVEALVERVDSDLPKLKSALARPVSLEFRDAPLRQVFEVLARTASLNFVFDRDVRADLRTSIFVRDSNVEDVVRLLLLTNQLAQKVLNDNSVLIYPNTLAKQKEYQDTIVRSFMLANAEAKQIATMLRTIAKIRDIHFDEKLNMLVIKDTPEAVRLAEKLIASQDLPEPEVVLQVEVIEISRSRLKTLGVRFPDAINFGPRSVAGAAAEASVPLSSTLIATVANPVLTLNLRQLDGTTNLLSNPRIRVRNREKARIHIGEKVPVFTTTQLANVGVTSSVNFLDVGLKLDVSPLVYLDDEVQITVGLEVSTIIQEVSGPAGTLAYRLGTRNTNTTLRIRDNETQVLAGLISDEDRNSTNRVPFLGELPIAGRLFSNVADNLTRTEIVLLITPRIVRNLERPEHARGEFFGGTDNAVGAQPLRIRRTQPQSLGVEPGGTAVTAAAAAASEASIPELGAPPVVALLWAAPTAVASGAEFTVAIGPPPGVSAATARMAVDFDPKAVELMKESLSGTGNVQVSALPGRANITFSNVDPTPRPPRELRFRMLGKPTTTTQLTVGEVAIQDQNGLSLNVLVPPPHVISITPK